MVDTHIEQEVFVQVIPVSQKASDALHTPFQMRVFFSYSWICMMSLIADFCISSG